MKVLVVDDTKNIRMLLTTCLELYGYEVVTAVDGLDALNAIQTSTPDLIFLDIKLPEISGTEVLRRIRSSGIITPVVIMTAFATVKNAIECTKLGAVAYLQKPFTADKVKTVINELINRTASVENSTEVNIKICKALIEDGELNESYILLKKQLAIDPTNGEVYFLIALLYDKKGNKEEAHRFYNIAKQFQY
ncbi:MAG: response regulator [Clostridiaceae bacterium]|nr:response regulator [Clostridiaceae bacterium]